MEYIYRFRSIDALLGKRAELEKQEIFFASTKQLNDPVEGYKDLFWRGDVIAWRNFLRHYALCLMQTILRALENIDGYIVTPENLPIRIIPEEFHPEIRKIFNAICAKMFGDPELSELPGLLEGRVSPIRRNELLSVLYPVHFRLFTLVCTTLQPDSPFHPIDAFFRERGAQPLRLKESFAALNDWDTKHPDNPDIVEAMTAKSRSAIEQTTFIRDYTGISQQHGPVWRVIGSTFPDVYLLSLENLSYGDWYTACFVADPTQASMWGYYGDGHCGACLKFKTTAVPSGEPALRLNRQVGIGGPPYAPERIFQYSPQPLQEVHYANRYPEVDFFRSLGTLIPAQAAFWFRGEDGTISSTGRDLVMQTEEWRKQYWDTFHAGVTTKLTDWEHEQEYRITLQSWVTNAFDLKIAGKCHSRGDHPGSRWELYSRYVRDTLEGKYIVASAFLRAIAGEMMESLTMAIGRDRFEALAESFYRQEQTPLAAVEELLKSRLVVPGDEYVWFEHELLLDFFKAQYLTRKTNVANDLASDLSRPRNAHLLELVLAQCDNETNIEAILAKADDVKPLGLALRGHCGPLAQTAVRKQCIALIDLGVAQLSTIKLSCQTFEGEDGKKRLVGFNIDGARPLSKYGALLCGVVAENLEEEAVQRDFLKLLELTDTRFLDAIQNAAQESGVSLRAAYSEALRSYGGLLHYGDGSPFVCSGILSAIRYSRMASPREQGPLPILSSLVRNVRTRERSYFSFFTLLIDLQRSSNELELDDLIDLAQRAWDTGIGWLRTEAVRMLNFLHHRAATLGEDQVVRIREVLQGFETKDVLVNTEILEALAGYDGFDPPVSEDAALTEMRDLIEATDEPNAEQAELALLLETTWPQYRREAAYGALGKIFEDIFMGVYYQAYRALTDDQRKKLLELAAMTTRPGTQIDWILWELLAISDAASLPIFYRFATELDADTSCTQEVVGAFLASIRGYARLGGEPPPIPDGTSDDRRAWAAIGSILFWWMKGADLGCAIDEISIGWRTISDEMSACFPDILQKVSESQWRNSEHSINLARLFPEQIRPLLESAIRKRKSLTSLFHYGGSSDERVLQTVIRTLEEIGNEGSIAVLEDLTEDPTFGKSAVQAIQALRRRH